MEIFGVGFFEIVAVLLLAAIIFGPHRLPELAGQMGRAVRELREYARDFRDEYLVDFEEVKEEYLEIRHELQTESQEFQAELEAADSDIRASLKEIEGDTQQAIAEAKRGESKDSARTDSKAEQVVHTQEGTETIAREPTRRGVGRRGRNVRRRAQQAPVARPSNVISLHRRRGKES
ncbi:MAG: twin-arginine translocase TatA/TatE family subunit [Chloroflexi bacterium]|nr:twin-arginine translocase TatA/TatE family subunit [Chloroflexota bacterium]